MFSSTILEVSIGLIFIFLLLSLLATTINEIILSLLYSARGKFLEKAIVAMLSDRHPEKESPVEVNDAEAGKKEGTGKIRHSLEPGGTADLAERFYAHPLIITLAKQGKNNKPSYISKATFSKVLLDLLSLPGKAETTVADVRAAVESLPDNKTKALLLSLLKDVGNDIGQVKASFEFWYEEMMDRATGWYKRRVQWILLAIGFFISVFLNADTIHMAKVLAADPEARINMVMQAQAFLKVNEHGMPGGSRELDSLTRQATTLIKEDIAAAGTVLGLGWSVHQRKAMFSSGLKSFWNELISYFPGWLLTAVAITLGAPFWFDMLNKVINIRNVGKKPEEKQA